MINKILLGVIGLMVAIILALWVAVGVKSKQMQAKQVRIETLERQKDAGAIEHDAAMIAAEAKGKIEQLDKEAVDENVTYDVGVFEYVFD